MSACDECWDRAFVIARRTGQHQAEVYRKLVAAERCNSTEYSNKACSEPDPVIRGEA